MRHTTSGACPRSDNVLGRSHGSLALLRRVGGRVDELLHLVTTKSLRIAELGEESTEWIEGFMKRYTSDEPELADAALIHLAERHHIEVVFALGRRDFFIYRLSRGKPLRFVPES